MNRPTILCPIDFSEPSRGALRFAATIAEHFYAGLTVVTVDDPVLSGAAGSVYGAGTYEKLSERELERFLKDTFRRRRPTLAELRLDVATGKPAIEILRVALRLDADLIVMSTHGRTGLSKVFFGSTTERVLRETTVPVLVTPSGDPGPLDLEDLTRGFGGVLAPIDLSPFSARQAAVAYGLAQALGTTLTLLHVVTPTMAVPERERAEQLARRERRRIAAAELAALAAALGDRPKATTMVHEGDPAEIIVQTALTGAMGAILMGLHDTTGLGPRMGSVAYRVLCRTQSPVLALPPAARGADRKPEVFARAPHRLPDHEVTASLPEGW
jgi:nucleotide-binding universal stress UspA family protein